MIEKKIKLKSIREVESFNKICSGFSCDMDLKSGKYYIDAKSIMGIFSLNLESDLTLIAHNDNEDEILEKFKDFIV